MGPPSFIAGQRVDQRTHASRPRTQARHHELGRQRRGARRQVGNTWTSVPLLRWVLAGNSGEPCEARARRGSFGERFTVVDAEAGHDGQRGRSPVFNELERPVAARGRRAKRNEAMLPSIVNRTNRRIGRQVIRMRARDQRLFADATSDEREATTEASSSAFARSNRCEGAGATR